MYTLELSIPNIEHRPWWWGGKQIYKFNTMDEVIQFIKAHMPHQDRYINFMIENDKERNRGTLGCTSWYRLRKGEAMMTDYTSY